MVSSVADRAFIDSAKDWVWAVAARTCWESILNKATGGEGAGFTEGLVLGVAEA